jgi:hypothetical protein
MLRGVAAFALCSNVAERMQPTNAGSANEAKTLL